jgi:glycerophosphoryl diester phosphodiesterase
MNRIVPFALVLFSVSYTACDDNRPAVPPTPVNPFMKAEGPALVVAHRGGRDLFPENTMTAFDGAVSLGVDILEMDICLTSDDVAVTIHDVTIDRTCEGSGAVLSYTFEELQAFNFGYHFQAGDGSFPYRDDPVRIPRLEQVFAAHPSALMIIEIKNPGATGKRAARILHDLAVEYNMADNVAVFSFQDDVMQYFRSINTGGLYTGGSVSDAVAFLLAAIGNNESDFRRNVDVFSLPVELEGINLITASDRIIEAAGNAGIAIHFWTINNREEMEQLVGNGADGIITDKPDLLLDIIGETG